MSTTTNSIDFSSSEPDLTTIKPKPLGKIVQLKKLASSSMRSFMSSPMTPKNRIILKKKEKYDLYETEGETTETTISESFTETENEKYSSFDIDTNQFETVRFDKAKKNKEINKDNSESGSQDLKRKSTHLTLNPLEVLLKQKKELDEISIKGNLKEAVHRANQFCLQNSIHSKNDDNTLKRASIFTKMLDFKRMGLGVYLYFSFYRELAFLYFMISLVASMYMIFYLNENSNNYNDTDSSVLVKYIKRSSFGKTKKEDFPITILFEVGFVILFVIWIKFSEFYLYLRKKKAYTHPDNLSPAHYTVFLKNLPQCITKKKIKKAFSHFGKIKYITFIDSNVKLINASNKLNEYFVKRTEIMLRNLTRRIKKTSINGFNVEDEDNISLDEKIKVPRKMKKINKKIEKYYERVEKYSQDKSLHTPIVFVTFNSVTSAFYCVETYNRLCTFKIKKRKNRKWVLTNEKGKVITVKRSHNPEDYIFQNIRYTKWQRIKRSIFLNIISLPLIFATTGVIYIIKTDPIKIFDQKIFELDFLISIVIYIITWSSKRILKNGASFRKSETITEYEGSQMGYIVSFQALNLVIPLILNYWSSEDFFGETSTIIFLNMIFSGFASPTIFILFQFSKKHWRRYKGRKKYSQYLLNQAYAPRKFELRNFYFTILRNLIFNLIFVSFYPNIIVPCLLSLFYIYLIHKILILRYYAKPIGYSDILHNSVLQKIRFLMYLHYIFYLLMVIVRFQMLFGQTWYILLAFSILMFTSIYYFFCLLTSIVIKICGFFNSGLRKLNKKNRKKFQNAPVFTHIYKYNLYQFVDWKELFGVENLKQLKNTIQLKNFDKENFQQQAIIQEKIIRRRSGDITIQCPKKKKKKTVKGKSKLTFLN
ncbi:putative transmembrane protein [Anaeramoeba flamelloides]|uniref:Transmembrane protein n=1 Tax=Anaeramoeba flamelloides TaxID=1746091 RepID=A0AAV7YMY9_9EUKA|nr:putative transmembrane protein [Anaeramoeba flamelloides]